MKNLWADRSLFESPYHLTLCTTEKQYKRELKRMKLPKSERPSFTVNAHSHAACHRFSTGAGFVCVVCIRHDKSNTLHQHNALLVHESVHLWQAIKEDIGEKNPSPEFEAYVIQNISQFLMIEFERQTK